jgi:hypothetical protein
MPVIIYACPAWEFATDTHQIKLQSRQNRFLSITGKFSRLTSIHDVHVAFQILCVYDCITKLCSNKLKLFQITKMRMCALLDKTNPYTEYVRGSNLAGVRRTTVQVIKSPFKPEVLLIGLHNLLYRARTEEGFIYCSYKSADIICNNIKLGCLHPVACTRSGSGFPSNATLFE